MAEYEELENQCPDGMYPPGINEQLIQARREQTPENHPVRLIANAAQTGFRAQKSPACRGPVPSRPGRRGTEGGSGRTIAQPG